MKVVKEKIQNTVNSQKNNSTLSKISLIFEEVSNLCVVLTIIICLIFSIFTLPRLFGIVPFVVQSSSMEPAIPTGSVVFVDTKDTDVKEGDIITYSLSTGNNSGVFVTHRVYKIDDENNLIQTKGDNNDNADGWIDKSAITGTAINYIPWCGFVLNSLQETGFVIIAIWMFVINLILMMIPQILNTLENMSIKKEG